MSGDLPDRLLERRGALVALVHDAFRDVHRRGGVSWSETLVMDDNGTAAERAAARARDCETHWSELVADPAWRIHESWGGFAFLDERSRVYYFAPALVRCLLESHPVLPAFWFRDMYAFLDDRQRHATARCILYFIRREEQHFRDRIAEVNRWMKEAGQPACTVRDWNYPAGEAHAWWVELRERWIRHVSSV